MARNSAYFFGAHGLAGAHGLSDAFFFLFLAGPHGLSGPHGLLTCFPSLVTPLAVSAARAAGAAALKAEATISADSVRASARAEE